MIVLSKVCGLNFNDLELYAVVNVLCMQSSKASVLSRSALAGATMSWVPGVGADRDTYGDTGRSF